MGAACIAFLSSWLAYLPAALRLCLIYVVTVQAPALAYTLASASKQAPQLPPKGCSACFVPVAGGFILTDHLFLMPARRPGVDTAPQRAFSPRAG